MMSQRRLRRPRTGSVRAIIGYLVNHDEDGDLLAAGAFHAVEALEGARQACEEEGYFLEKFRWDDFAKTPRRLLTCLRARKSPGVIFCGGDVPVSDPEAWKNFSLSSVDNRRMNVSCDFTCTDHHQIVWLAMEELRKLGYERIGFAMTRLPWVKRMQYRAPSAYLGWKAQSGMHSLPIFLEDKWDRDQFLRWVRQHQPQVVIASEHTPLEYLKAAGHRIPEDIGFVHLDVNPRWKELAGIRQHHFKVGETAAHLVIDQINRNCYGVPDTPKSVLIAGDWQAGPSVRKIG